MKVFRLDIKGIIIKEISSVFHDRKQITRILLPFRFEEITTQSNKK